MSSTLAPEVLSRPTNELPYLKFHNKYLGPILSGDKVSTIRRKPINIKRDGVILAKFTDTSIWLKLVISDLGTKRFKDLTSEDAYFEGYNNLQDLKDELENIYPSIKPKTKIYYYRFAVVGGS